MVLLLPLLEGERLKSCSCGALGLGSPVRERTTFYIRDRRRCSYVSECRRCSYLRCRRYQQEVDWSAQEVRRRRVRRAEMGEAEREAVRRKQLVYERRYRERHREEINARSRERWAWREEREVAVAEVWKSTLSGIRLPIGPFRAWLEGLVEEARRAYPEEEPEHHVCARLDVSKRTLYRYRNEWEEVDESIVDRCVSRDGRVALFELYPEQLEYEPAQMALEVSA